MEKLSDKEWLALKRYSTAPLSEVWRDAIDIVLLQRRAEREGVMATGDSLVKAELGHATGSPRTQEFRLTHEIPTG
jgi:hypothetical protein